MFWVDFLKKLISWGMLIRDFMLGTMKYFTLLRKLCRQLKYLKNFPVFFGPATEKNYEMSKISNDQIFKTSGESKRAEIQKKAYIQTVGVQKKVDIQCLRNSLRYIPYLRPEQTGLILQQVVVIQTVAV